MVKIEMSIKKAYYYLLLRMRAAAPATTKIIKARLNMLSNPKFRSLDTIKATTRTPNPPVPTIPSAWIELMLTPPELKNNIEEYKTFPLPTL
jgi:hypothetical protein